LLKLGLFLVQEKSFGGAEDKLLASLYPFEERGVNQADKNGTATRLFTFRCPVYLPSEHTVAKNFIWDKHERHCHADVQLLLRLVRE
jgi:hypothetical protein